MSSFYWFFKAVFYIIFKAVNRLEVFGSQNIPEKGGVILAANHMSYLDPLLIGAAIKRRATYMAREGLFKIPVLSAFVKSFSFPVRRDRPLPSTIKEAVKRLRGGELIVMFPEGSRSADGSLLDAKRGVGAIAAISRIPVVPVLIKGTDKALPVGAKFLRPSKIAIIFGKPIEVDKEETDKKYRARISGDIIKAIRNLNFTRFD